MYFYVHYYALSWLLLEQLQKYYKLASHKIGFVPDFTFGWGLFGKQHLIMTRPGNISLLAQSGQMMLQRLIDLKLDFLVGESISSRLLRSYVHRIPGCCLFKSQS
jgi:hypothetical protein